MKKVLKYAFLSNFGRVILSFVILLISIGMVENMIMEDFFYIVELVSGGVIALHIVLAIVYAFIINPIRESKNKK
jgi:hypothetical protein